MFKNPNFKNACDLLCDAHGAALDGYFATLPTTVETVTADDIRAAVPGLAGESDGMIEQMARMRGFERA